MIRIVLDTNIFVSAFRSRNGSSFEIVDRLERGDFALVLSQTVLAEYEEVMKRELIPLGFTNLTIEQFLDDLCRRVEIFRPSGFWKTSLPDPDDESLAQLAMESKIDYLVTHNLRHFPAHRLPAIRVVDPKSFLNILRKSP
jgi:putative PIN family toxin of toxin-antitoxin system